MPKKGDNMDQCQTVFLSTEDFNGDVSTIIYGEINLNLDCSISVFNNATEL